MNLTQRDSDQIIKHTHDEKLNANRVVLVNGLNIDSKEISGQIAQGLSDALGRINFTPAPSQPMVNFPSVQTLEVPVIVKEYETIEKPVYIYETKIVEVEKPVMVETIKYIEIEKQVLVKEQLILEIKIPEIIREYEKVPIWTKVSIGLFLALSLLTNIILIIKK